MNTNKKTKVTYFFRKPQAQYHSIERVFDLIIQNLPEVIEPYIYKLKSGNRGIIPRIKAFFEVRKNRGTINHITGDISYVALALPKKGLIITFHDLESLKRSNKIANIILRWFWIKIPAQKAEIVTVISNHTKEKVIKWTGISENKIFVIPNPLPAEYKYSPKPFNNTEPAILAMGTKYNKNLEGTIKAISDIKCKLILIGQPDENQLSLLKENNIKYENIIKASDEQILDTYIGCDILCFPSFFEGFGMPIIEAQAIGRPVITSNIGAMKEVAGEGAYFVNPESAEDIREAINSIIVDTPKRQKIIDLGLENIKEYNSKKIAKKYCSIYN